MGVAAAIAFGALTLWITWRVANPKRRLLYGMPVATPLLNAGQDVRHGLEVRRGDHILTDPHVLEVTLFNQGRLDIPSSAFDRGRPLTLDVGVPVLDILKTTTSPDHAVPTIDFDGTALKIGPDLLGRRQKISFSLLVDGPDPALSCPPPHPINIQVVRNPDEPTKRLRWDLAVLGGMAGGP